ncbi:hypothetical protein CLV98_11341 [Dyadobacter jejuensis]|uniref:Uncharacterized protein n=1 Tax=Dyadobacter jejuensis TaxID=1082580 RepID=A0A316ACT3_9BACT|nr:DUF6660 family protein [Dyadobacter jejuensis]PWJ55565.1 hypothetical protein CLV98_11341 [Dyadobacter jejuensis]
MNKLKLYLLALYTVALACVPCDDGMAVPLGSDSVTIMAVHLPSDPGNDGDHCTVFCACTCCASTVIVQALDLIPQIKGYVREDIMTFSPYSMHSVSRINNIWQPPQR